MIRIKFGNNKLGDNIGILNMGTSTECPSRSRGLCVPVNKGIKCYAYKAEQQYKEHCLGYRRKQEEYWKNTSKEQIVKDIAKKIKNRRKVTDYIRLNEAGDFWSQEDVDKADYIAEQLKRMCKVQVYAHSARSDLNFSDNKALLVKGSGHTAGNNGQSMVLDKYEAIPKGYFECPGQACGVLCNLCMSNGKHKIAFRRH